MSEDATAAPPVTVQAQAAAPAVPAPQVGSGPMPGFPPVTGTPPASDAGPAAPVAHTSDDTPVVTVEMPPLGPIAPRPVPSLSDAPKRAAWSGESDHRPVAGPMFPDLFEQAVAGSALASAITVNYSDGEHRETLDVANYASPGADSPVLVSTDGRMPVEVGAFTGASAKKRRWRL